jgi:YjbE family integral membrane protein
VHLSSFWVGVMQIIWINILLSGDNAVVIALACLNLPKHVRFWGMVLGAGAAILMRIFFTLIISTLMTLPYLKIVGGLALFYIAVKLLLPEEDGDGETIEASEKLWSAVRVIAIADVIMSLDNVIAIAAAARGHAALYVFGLAVSIPLIVAGARIVMELLSRYPILVWAGGALLGWIAGQVIVTDPAIRGFLTMNYGDSVAHMTEYVGATIGVIIVVASAWMLRRSREAKSNVDVAS